VPGRVYSEISSFFTDRTIKQPGKQLHETKQATEQPIKQPHQKSQQPSNKSDSYIKQNQQPN